MRASKKHPTDSEVTLERVSKGNELMLEAAARIEYVHVVTCLDND